MPRFWWNFNVWASSQIIFALILADALWIFNVPMQCVRAVTFVAIFDQINLQICSWSSRVTTRSNTCSTFESLSWTRSNSSRIELTKFRKRSSSNLTTRLQVAVVVDDDVVDDDVVGDVVVGDVVGEVVVCDVVVGDVVVDDVNHLLQTYVWMQWMDSNASW